jgi:hypothetical protein
MRRARLPRRLLWTVLPMLIGTNGRAQSGMGTLVGTVVDAATHAPIAGVTVQATSSSLQGEQVVVSDGSGAYHLPQLPAGEYVLRFARDEYRVYERRGIALQSSQTLRFDPELLPEAALAETIVVERTPPLIDIGSTRTGLVVGGQVAEQVPLELAAPGGVRDAVGLALVAPQTQRDLYGIAIDGSTSPENQVLLDGLSINDTAYAVPGTRFSVEFTRQVDVITGGYLPEYGRSTGGILSLVSKSGGNEFHGSVFLTFTPGALAQSGKVVADNNTVFGARTSLYNAGDLGFTLGGYLIRDRLWFFVGFDPSFERDSLERSISVFDLDSSGDRIPTAGGYVRTAVPSATRRYFQDTRVYPFFGKLTAALTPDHRLSLSVSGVPSRSQVPFARGVNGTLDALSLQRSSDVFDVVAQLNSSFSDKAVLLDVIVGWHHQRNDDHPFDGSQVGSGLAALPYVQWGTPQSLANFAAREPGYTPELAALCALPDSSQRCRVAGYATGGPDIRNELFEDRIQVKAIGTGFFRWLGHHVFKAGLDADFSQVTNRPLLPEGARYFPSGTPGDPSTTFQSEQQGYLGSSDQPVLRTEGLQVTTRSLIVGGFVQDSWSIADRVTLNAGIRFDSETLFDASGRVALVLNDQWSPRLGVIWDPTNRGRAKIFASYALYYEQIPLRLTDFGFSHRSLLGAVFGNCRDPSIAGNGRCDTQPGSVLLPGGAGPNRYWTAYAFDELADPDTASQRTQEVVAGAEYEILPGTRLGVSYTHRGMSRIIEDFSLNQSTFSVGNPGQGIGASLTEPSRNYDAFTIALGKTFDGRWLLQGSYTYSVLTGNTPGLFTPETAKPEVTDLGPNVSELYDFPPLRVNRSGPLPSDSRHQLKAYGAYRLQLSGTVGMSFGAGYNGRSGAPISALAGFDGYGPNEVFILPRGIVGRLPWIHQVDLHATLDLALSAGTVLSLGADCFNVLGSQQVVAVDQSYVFPPRTEVVPIPNGTMADLPSKLMTPDGQPLPADKLNANFGRATQYQLPRRVRFLARLNF